MIEKYNLSFLNLEPIKKVILSSNSNEHGLLTEGFSSFNYGMPILEHPELKSLYIIIQKCVGLYCNKYDVHTLKFINSWFNISQSGNKLKAHNHGETGLSGAFYLSGKTPLIFPDTSIQPYPGLLIIFPSSFIHYTEEETEERIVISFNTDYL